METVLIIGGSGFLGSHLAARLKGGYRVVTTRFRHSLRMSGVTEYPLTVSQNEWAKELVMGIQPQIVIYAAGSCDLRWTEDPENARELELQNITGSTTLMAASQLVGSRFIYVSSALVFDGTRGNYHESDVLVPNTGFGRSKLSAENSIRSRALNYLLVRSAPLLGRGPAGNPSLLDRWLHQWGHGRPVELDERVRHSYAPVEEFADWMVRCIESGTKNRTLHFGGLSRCTEHELGTNLAKRLGVPDSLVVRKSAKADAQMRDYSLNTSASVRALEVKPLFLKQSLDLVEKRLLVP